MNLFFQKGRLSVDFVYQVMHITKYEIWYLDFADRSVTYPKGIIEDVLIRLKKFVFLADFFILDTEEDHDIPLLLGWPFFTVAGTLKVVQQGTLTLRVKG